VKKSDAASVQLKSYPAPWKGQLVLVCSKCTRKLKHHGDGSLNVKRWLKTRQKESKTGNKLKILAIKCVKMCPKNGVTIATQQQLSRKPAEVSIIRSEADLEMLYQQLSS